jgi:site-specific DNA-methyltransferase (adenine-specific)
MGRSPQKDFLKNTWLQSERTDLISTDNTESLGSTVLSFSEGFFCTFWVVTWYDLIVIQLKNDYHSKQFKGTEFDFRHGDCITGMASIAEESVDIVVTSPPYNLGIKYSKYDDRQHRDAYLKWSIDWATAAKRTLKSDGSLFLNVGASPSNPFLPHQIALAFGKIFTLQNTFHWIKSISVETKRGEMLSVGHFKPINSYRYVTDCHEYVFHFTPTGKTTIDRLAVGVPYVDKTNVSRWGHTNGNDKRCRGNNWFIPYKTIQSREEQRPHPATFPAELAEYCIRIHGCEVGMVVLDPFLGIGHSALAAKNCDVSRFIGFDIDAGYIATARELVSD